MAIHSSTYWEVNLDGHPLNGGGYAGAYGGQDRTYPVSNVQLLNAPSLVGAVLSDSGYTFVSGDLGNIVALNNGSTIERRLIVAVASGSATLDQTPAITPTSARLGGAVSHPAIPFASVRNENHVYVRSGTYINNVNAYNVDGGRIQFPDNDADLAIKLQGYSGTRYSALGVNRPIFQVQAGMPTWTGNDGLIKVRPNGSSIYNMHLIGDNYQSIGIKEYAARSVMVSDCKIEGFLVGASAHSSGWLTLRRCEVYGTNKAGCFSSASASLINCLCIGGIASAAPGPGAWIGNIIHNTYPSYQTMEYLSTVRGCVIRNADVRMQRANALELSLMNGSMTTSGGYGGRDAIWLRDVFLTGTMTIANYLSTPPQRVNVQTGVTSPFVSWDTLDYRLTEAAKNGPNGVYWKKLATMLQGVPIVTLDTMDELYPPLLEPAFYSPPTFFPSPPIAGRPLYLTPGTANTTAVDREWIVYDEDGDPEENAIAVTTENEVLLPASVAGKEIVVQETITTADGKAASAVVGEVAVSAIGTTGVLLNRIVSARTTTARTSTVK
jgi:hypothetical protein